MLQPLMETLKSARIVLASGSPRRKQILQNIGLNVEVIPSTYEEDLDKAKFDHPGDFVIETARRKTEDVARRLAAVDKLPDLIIGADTIVCLLNTIFGKPRNKEHAVQMLNWFKGKTHKVYTGVVMIAPAGGIFQGFQSSPDGKYTVQVFYEATEVVMGFLSDEVIQEYVETEECLDKAGGYGIQGIGGTLIEKVHGCYFNVMGFPLYRFCTTLVIMHEHAKNSKK